jgi:hypothetical protein
METEEGEVGQGALGNLEQTERRLIAHRQEVSEALEQEEPHLLVVLQPLIAREAMGEQDVAVTLALTALVNLVGVEEDLLEVCCLALERLE